MSTQSSSNDGARISDRIDPEAWRRAAEVFDRVSSIAPERRERALTRECAGDARLRSRVMTMLEEIATDRNLNSFAVHARALESLEAPLAGTRIGSYRVLRELGQGGMGLVWLAERADGEFEQRVAIKVLRRGHDSRRLQMERQILARLRHPHIARLLDGGTLHDGTPYVVMEYIRGQSIDRYCRARELGLTARISLFLQLCDAVAHAHRNLIIHRDLKPGNILIDAQGVLKLLDFGIAKLQDHDIERTATADRRLTPAYASPEQLTGQPITATSDVYSLGVVLFELVCDRRPFAELESSVRDFEDAVANLEAERPSRVSKERFARQLRGDLDRIILKALAADPERRYCSVQDLSSDLIRHREGRPVRARPASMWYRMSRFAARNRLGVAAAVIILMVAGVQQQRVLHERDVAAQERDHARRERDLAQRERDAAAANPFYMIDMFAAESDGPQSPRQMIDQGARRISEQYADQPQVLAQLAASMGSVYQSMGRYDSAARMYGEALESERLNHGNDAPEVARALVRLSRLHYYRGLYDTAEPLAVEALAIVESADTSSLERAEVADLLGSINRYQGKLTRAEAHLRDGLRGRLALLGEDHGDTGTSLNNLAGVLKDSGHFSEAVALSRRAIASFQTGLGEDHPDTIMGLNNLGQALHLSGQRVEAESVYRDALVRHDRALGAEHPSRADILDNLGVVLMELAQPDEALPALQAALDLRQQWLGPDHPRVAVSHSNMGRLLRFAGDPGAALIHFESARRIVEAQFGEAHARVAIQRAHFAAAANDLALYQEAEAAARGAWDTLQTSLESGHSQALTAALELVRALIGQRRLGEAEQLAAQLEAIVSDQPERLQWVNHRLTELGARAAE